MQSNCALTSNLRYKTDVLVPLSFEGLITSLSKFATCAKSRENWQRLVLILDTKVLLTNVIFLITQVQRITMDMHLMLVMDNSPISWMMWVCQNTTIVIVTLSQLNLATMLTFADWLVGDPTHQRVPGFVLGRGFICGLSWLLVLILAPTSFSLSTPGGIPLSSMHCHQLSLSEHALS